MEKPKSTHLTPTEKRTSVSQCRDRHVAPQDAVCRLSDVCRKTKIKLQQQVYRNEHVNIQSY